MTIPLVNHHGDISFAAALHAWPVKPTPLNSLGARLSAARDRAGLGQKQLEAETGVRQSRISDLENDKKVNINVWQAHALCKRLGITVEYLLTGAKRAAAEEVEAVALLRNAEPELREAAMNALRGMLSGKARATVNSH